MSKIKEKIQADVKEAMHAKDEVKVTTLRMLLSAISNEEIAKKKKKEGLKDEEAIEVISRQIKQRDDAAEQYKKGERNDLAEKELKEKEILAVYLPPQLSEEEIKKMVKEAVEKTGAQGPKGMGKVMGALMPKVKGKADGGLVSRLVKEALGE